MVTLKTSGLRRLRADSRGTTMAEICVALMILSLGMVSILALFPKALHTTRNIIGLTAGSMVARSAMATMVYEIEADSVPVWATGGTVGPVAFVTDSGTGLVLYWWKATVDAADADGVINLHKTTIDVYGRAGISSTPVYTCVTYLAEPGT